MGAGKHSLDEFRVPSSAFSSARRRYRLLFSGAVDRNINCGVMAVPAAAECVFSE